MDRVSLISCLLYSLDLICYLCIFANSRRLEWNTVYLVDSCPIFFFLFHLIKISWCSLSLGEALVLFLVPDSLDLLAASRVVIETCWRVVLSVKIDKAMGKWQIASQFQRFTGTKFNLSSYLSNMDHDSHSRNTVHRSLILTFASKITVKMGRVCHVEHTNFMFPLWSGNTASISLAKASHMARLNLNVLEESSSMFSGILCAVIKLFVKG